ncbi:MAG TPA: c-type cytochrome [Acidobacteriota bacterium]|nr:c-type cytochrome [Acidobacteriota bacterium]
MSQQKCKCSLSHASSSTLVSGLVLGSLLILGVFSTGCSSMPASNSELASLIERGEYLVSALGCEDCHTPFEMGPDGPQPDRTRHLSGHPQDFKLPAPPLQEGSPWLWMGAATNTAFAGPWGISYASNLTPDENTGMGIWTEEMFISAIRTGKHMGQSRPIMPPMPWQAYSNLTDEDLSAIFAYLRTVRPISNRVPEYSPPGRADAGQP